MADDTATPPTKVPNSRVLSKKEANRIAAAKAYIAAMEKAGQEVPASVKKLAEMADEAGTTPRKASTSRVVSKKEANRIAAAKAYIAAMKKAGQEVPESVKKLARLVGETDNAPGKVSKSRVVSKRAANRAAAAKVYIVAMKKTGQEVPEWVKELAKQAD